MFIDLKDKKVQKSFYIKESHIKVFEEISPKNMSKAVDKFFDMYMASFIRKWKEHKKAMESNK